MSNLCSVHVDRILGRTTGVGIKASQTISCSEDGTLLAYAAGCIVGIKKIGEEGVTSETYLSLPRVARLEGERSHGTPTQTSRKDSLSVLSFEEFAEPSKGKEKTKPIVSLAVSPDGRYVACGEQGQAPRICIWDMKADDMHLGPVHIINVHSYGVKHLVFSPNSQFLVSVGYLHDGTIHIWDLRGGVRKVATNRLTANVKSVVCLGNRLLSIGTRHVRLWQWKIESTNRRRRSSMDCTDSTSILEGRNIVLGPHVHSDFVAACAIDAHRALVATTRAVCYVNGEDKQPLHELFRVDFDISALCAYQGNLFIGDAHGTVRRYEFDQCASLVVQEVNATAIPPVVLEPTDDQDDYGSAVAAMFSYASLGNSIGTSVALANGSMLVRRHGNRRACLLSPSANSLALYQGDGDTPPKLILEDGLLTTSDAPMNQRLSLSDGSIISAVKILDDQCILYGTTLGQVSCFLSAVEQRQSSVQAHEGAVCMILNCGRNHQILSAGKDRMIQLLERPSTSDDFELVVKQTFDDHSASITGMLFVAGRYIVSSSADRTIYIRSKVESNHEELYATSRIIDLRSMATTISTTTETSSSILISCLDKSLLILDVETGDLRELCKTEDSYDLMVVHATAGTCCCVSSTDKSIILRSATTGAALSQKGYGHIERITSVTYSNEREDVVLTTSIDGMVIYWWFQPVEQTVGPSTPVRKIKTKMESLRLGFATRTGNTIRRSSSVPRLSNGTPTRALSPSKLGIDRRSPSPKRPSSIVTLTPQKDKDLNTGCCSVEQLVKYLATMQQRQDAISPTQFKELRDAAAWLHAA